MLLAIVVNEASFIFGTLYNYKVNKKEKRGLYLGLQFELF